MTDTVTLPLADFHTILDAAITTLQRDLDALDDDLMSVRDPSEEPAEMIGRKHDAARLLRAIDDALALAPYPQYCGDHPAAALHERAMDARVTLEVLLDEAA